MGNVDDDTKPPAVTQLDDARVLKKLGAPLNKPVVHREFRPEYTERWIELQNAYTRFMSALVEFVDGPRAGSARKWRHLVRRLDGMHTAMTECDALVGKLSGNVTPPVFETDQDRGECLAMSFFLTERAMPFVDFWDDALDAVDAGTELMIRPEDIPPWLDADEAP
jgi:hypothetical protein